ncbi:MAG: hypothetical protein ABF665_09155, partial [Gluconacetobacter sp.]
NKTRQKKRERNQLFLERPDETLGASVILGRAAEGGQRERCTILAIGDGVLSWMAAGLGVRVERVEIVVKNTF